MNAAVSDHRPGVLQEYARLKLELAAIVRELLHIAERQKYETSMQECRRVLARLAEDRFNLAILGQFSRGKSSLMNALLGSEKLPTGILPLTSVITTVTYGESEKVLLQREGWSIPQEIHLDQLAEFVTQRGNPGNEKRVTLAEVQLSNELLRFGVHFIDTPGVASAIAANTRTTRQFLPEADAAIMVTSFESPLTEAELKFLEETREHVRRIFVVVNKVDLVSSAERDPVLASVRETLRASFPDSDFEVFAISARDALRAKQAGSSEALAASGLPRLEAALTSFLRCDKAQELLLRAAERTENVARQQEVAIRISQRARSPQEAAVLKERLKDILESVTNESEAIVQRMGDRLRDEFPRRCEEAIGLWSPEFEALSGSEVASWASDQKGDLAGDKFNQFIESLSKRLFSEWLSLHRDKIDQHFQALIQRDSAALEELSLKISRVLSDVLGRDDGANTLPPQSIDASSLVFREISVQVDGLQAPWWYELLPLGRPMEIVKRRWLKRMLPEFGRRYQDAALLTLNSAGDDWVQSLSRRLTTEITSMDSHISSLLTQRPKLVELPEIERVLDRVHGFMKAVLRMGAEEGESGASLTSSEGGQRAASIRPCMICLRAERALWDFLAHRQYELAVSESDQRQHALHSGFCPLHTWQYESIASPQGVCAAYPQLLTLFAKRLRVLARDATSVQSIESGVRSMLPNESLCEVCQLIDSTERGAAEEIVRQLGNDNGSIAAVCAFHLRSVLSAGSPLKGAVRLVLEEAGVFERLAEDMQNHVLKHEAVRHYLSTNAERQSATAGLSRLVGRRDTVAPRKVE